MRILTEYDDLFIRNLIEQAGGKPYKCTANVQYGIDYPNLIPVLVIYQDYSQDWDLDDRVIYCEKIETLDFCEEMHITSEDLHAMIEYYSNVAFQQIVNDIEYEEECIEQEMLHDIWMAEELAWYNHARQLGWE